MLTAKERKGTWYANTNLKKDEMALLNKQSRFKN